MHSICLNGRVKLLIIGVSRYEIIIKFVFILAFVINIKVIKIMICFLAIYQDTYLYNSFYSYSRCI